MHVNSTVYLCSAYTAVASSCYVAAEGCDADCYAMHTPKAAATVASTSAHSSTTSSTGTGTGSSAVRFGV
jgi:hypothetical protein